MISLDRFLYALGIPQIGSATSKIIAKNFNTLEGFLEKIYVSPDEILRIDGIGEGMLLEMQNYLSHDFIKEQILGLSKLLTIMPYENKSTNSLISGKTIVFTGTLDHMTRSEAKERAEQLGAKVSSSVSRNTDFLVCGIDSGSKEKKAFEMNVKVLKEEEWLIMINGGAK